MKEIDNNKMASGHSVLVTKSKRYSDQTSRDHNFHVLAEEHGFLFLVRDAEGHGFLFLVSLTPV
jgi:hypothetical protein